MNYNPNLPDEVAETLAKAGMENLTSGELAINNIEKGVVSGATPKGSKCN